MEQNIRTFKDFLEFYNRMSETCFSHCIDTFKSRNLETHESDCVERCAHKLIRYNNRAIAVYADLQTRLMEKRAKDMEAAEKKAEQELTNNNVAPETAKE